jgi:hypothetical protein
VKLGLGGDHHHYQRLFKPQGPQDGAQDGCHYVTYGTGGAFLHPTHLPLPSALAKKFSIVKSYPPAAVSKRLARENFNFLVKNPWFGFVPGTIYVLVGWVLSSNMGLRFGNVSVPEIGTLGISQYTEAFRAVFHSAILNPIALALYLTIWAGFVGFTKSRSRAFRWVAGLLHAHAHLFLNFLIVWLVGYFCTYFLGYPPKSIRHYLTAAGLIFVLGFAGGSFIMGLYLWLSLNFFHEHFTQAFSSLRIEDWKGFLRMQICPDRRLKVHYVGIRRVPRKWKRKDEHAPGPVWVPDDPKSSAPTLEDYFEIPSRTR